MPMCSFLARRDLFRAKAASRSSILPSDELLIL
jgi:hypothetical protein